MRTTAVEVEQICIFQNVNMLKGAHRHGVTQEPVQEDQEFAAILCYTSKILSQKKKKEVLT